MKKVEIIHDTRTDDYEIWVWNTNFDCEQKACRKTLKSARNAAHKYGWIWKESEI